MNSPVIFWEQMDGIIVAQKENVFFSIPEGFAEMTKESKDFRKDIASSIDSAPLTTNSMVVSGAVEIDRIQPNTQ